VLIQTQVRLEEEFLSRTHGEHYAEYRRRVRRWL
jgi:protein-S-isoprenylcysteine O-methyltransferase Ste14